MHGTLSFLSSWFIFISLGMKVKFFPVCLGFTFTAVLKICSCGFRFCLNWVPHHLTCPLTHSHFERITQYVYLFLPVWSQTLWVFWERRPCLEPYGRVLLCSSSGNLADRQLAVWVMWAPVDFVYHLHCLLIAYWIHLLCHLLTTIHNVLLIPVIHFK